MNVIFKIGLLSGLFQVCVTVSIESITITNPADSTTVNGTPLLINGTSSQANTQVLLTINTTDIAVVLTDPLGDWNYTYSLLENGNYLLTAKLRDDSYSLFAEASSVFTTTNQPTISIVYPANDELVDTTGEYIEGVATATGAMVRILVDSAETNTVTTDSSGHWSSKYPWLTDGVHILEVKLYVGSVEISNTSLAFVSRSPIMLANNVSQIKLIEGIVPTSGSGSGNGYLYNVVGSDIVLTFSGAFPSVPCVVATGQYSSGPSTSTLSFVSTSSAIISFTALTEYVHFIASTCMI